MKRFLATGFFLASLATAQADCMDFFFCSRCDPGNSKDASGSVKCYDCDTSAAPPDCKPFVHCLQCSSTDHNDWGTNCKGCILVWTPIQ